MGDRQDVVGELGLRARVEVNQLDGRRDYREADVEVAGVLCLGLLNNLAAADEQDRAVMGLAGVEDLAHGHSADGKHGAMDQTRRQHGRYAAVQARRGEACGCPSEWFRDRIRWQGL